MRLAVLLALILSLLVGLGSAPAEAAKKKPVSCAAKAKKIKNAKKRAAAQRKCKQAACTAKAKKIKSAKKRAAALRKCNKKPVPAKKPAPAKPAPPVPVPAPGPPSGAPRVEGGVDDVTVVAVLDGGINPYHWDFLSAKMPQHQDAIAGNDLPLDRPASDWLPGFGGMKSLTRIDLELDAADPEAPFGDEKPLQKLKTSSPEGQHAYWMPGTKIIGAMLYADDYEEPQDLWQGPDAHGVGTTSSLVGNLHGTCPECLLFFIDYGPSTESAEAAIQWAQSQPWIDVISNSYGHGGTVPKIYAGSDIDKQRAAVERGQQIVFSGGNGVENAYVASNPTELSSQKGPDWILTVGAAAPGEDNHYGADSEGGAYSGAGKPVDVAGVGSDYPNAYGAKTVSGVGDFGFGGSSNAAPTVAGLYARSLYLARTALAGPSRVQAGGVIATGDPIACGPARSDCELGDGRLTEVELRTRLLHGAVNSAGGTAVGAQVANPTAPAVGEEELMGEGHGTYFARQAGPQSSAWLAELERIVGPMAGRAPALERPAGEKEWFVVDSYCRQQEWGAWTRGYFVDGVTELPGSDPAWPMRSAREDTCLGGPTPLG
jgi:hypothetical protein